jgi:hypothetical protein
MLRSRSGLSVLEVILGLAAILLVLALLLPALQPVRDGGGRRSQCQDHLHNFAIAIHNYESFHKALPPGWVNQVPHGSNWGWGALLLRDVEQRPLYDALRVDGPNSLAQVLSGIMPVEGKELITRVPIDLFRCPSDTGPDTNAAMPFTDSRGVRHELALANYVGNHGPDWSADPLSLRGVFGENSHVTFPDISDGLSLTIFIGERSWNLPKPHDKSQCDAAVILGVSGDGTSTFERYALGIGRSGINSARIGPGGRPGCSDGFASHHPGGVNVALGDGKVAFLSNEIDQTVLERLLDKSDGETVEVP